MVFYPFSGKHYQLQLLLELLHLLPCISTSTTLSRRFSRNRCVAGEIVVIWLQFCRFWLPPRIALDLIWFCTIRLSSRKFIRLRFSHFKGVYNNIKQKPNKNHVNPIYPTLRYSLQGRLYTDLTSTPNISLETLVSKNVFISKSDTNQCLVYNKKMRLFYVLQ